MLACVICGETQGARMAEHFILMGDIVASRAHEAKRLSRSFRRLVAGCNAVLEPEILSPYTITLGDEFQGVARSLEAALRAIFYLEETGLKMGLEYRLRYVLLRGAIETRLNRRVAHGMVGPGLARARAMLTDKRRGRPRFTFDLPDRRLAEQLGGLFTAIDGITARWPREDGSLVCDMLASDSNGDVGAKHGKDRTQVWKRRKNLLITEYKALKRLALGLSNP